MPRNVQPKCHCSVQMSLLGAIMRLRCSRGNSSGSVSLAGSNSYIQIYTMTCSVQMSLRGSSRGCICRNRQQKIPQRSQNNGLCGIFYKMYVVNLMSSQMAAMTPHMFAYWQSFAKVTHVRMLPIIGNVCIDAGRKMVPRSDIWTERLVNYRPR